MKWLKAIGFALTGLALTGIGYQLIESYRDRRRFAAPGRLVNAGGILLHLHEQGAGRPVVVLEAGIAGTSIGWSLVQPEIARFTTVCSYDRAGLGWSAAQRGPRTVRQMTLELADLLKASGLPGPYVLVGHSFGGLLILAFAELYPQLVSGLVFLDPVSIKAWSNSSESERKRVALAASLSRRGAMLARLGIVRAALALLMSGKTGISKRIGSTAAGKGAAVLERLIGEVQKLPPAVWPAIRSHWSNPKSFLGMAAYLECLPACALQAIAMKVPASVPVTILSAGNATPAELAERDAMISGRARAQHVVVPGAGHWIQLEGPEKVVDCVRKLTKTQIDFSG